ncbi:MAG TPA: hypothetical protein VEH04_09435 [Verrucomicrobiae bacterium]|nr:hypothetical protein [Verrucomicrobiae bacterium]
MKALRKSVQQDVKFSRPLVLPIRVRCGSQQCLAYRDKTGMWIDYENGEPIFERVEVIRNSPHRASGDASPM